MSRLSCTATFHLFAVGVVALSNVSPAKGAPATWASAGFADAEHRALGRSEIYGHDRTGRPYRFNATVVYARNTPWTEARALRQIRKTASIFAPCGIEFGEVDLVRVRLVPALRRLDTGATDPELGVPTAVARISEKIPRQTHYPVAFLIGQVLGTESLAISYRALDLDGRTAPYFNTAWIGYRAHWLPRRDDLYSPLAHEFAHLLCRCGHSTSDHRHLLHTARNFLSSDVLPEHCRAFVSSSLVSVKD